TMIVASGQPCGDPLVEAAEVLAHALAERLQRLEAVAREGGVDADALAGAMVHRHEDTDLTVLGGHRGGHVGAPHLVGVFRDDGPIMGLGAVGMSDPLRGLKAVLPHEPADALLRGPDPLEAEPGPDFAVTLARERRLG